MTTLSPSGKNPVSRTHEAKTLCPDGPLKRTEQALQAGEAGRGDPAAAVDSTVSSPGPPLKSPKARPTFSTLIRPRAPQAPTLPSNTHPTPALDRAGSDGQTLDGQLPTLTRLMFVI